jgi:hypothetical protein
MLDGWIAFIEICEDSYDMSIHEYDNDLSVRSRIELMFGTADLRAHPAVRYIAEQVEPLDQRFRQLLVKVSDRASMKGWWRQGVLRYAAWEYAADVYNEYGIEIEVR